MFSVEWPGGGHTLLAEYHPLQGVLIADRSGVLVKNLSELTKFYGPGIAKASVYGDMALIEAARLIKRLNASSLVTMLGLEIMAVLSPEVKQAQKQTNRPSIVPTLGGAQAVPTVQRRIQTTHIAIPGDSLSKIAARFYHDMQLWPLIYDLNVAVVGPDYNKIKPGQVLKIAELASYTPADIARARDRARQWRL